MAMAMQQRALADFLKRGRKSVRLGLACQEFFEQQRMIGHAARRFRFDECGNLVAEPEQTTGLQPDHRHTARDIGRKRRKRAFGFAPRVAYLTNGKKRTAATERTRRAIHRLGYADAI